MNKPVNQQRPAVDAEENAQLKRLAITRVPSDTFLWNGFRYSHARDAIAAANREAAK